MAARCRCGDPIEWHHAAGRRTAYDPDGHAHECSGPPIRAAYDTRRPGPKRQATIIVTRRPTPTPRPQPAEPAHITAHGYATITELAARYGCRERDLAWNIAYRAALATNPTTQTAS